MKKRIWAVLLALAMVITLLPATAMASGTITVDPNGGTAVAGGAWTVNAETKKLTANYTAESVKIGGTGADLAWPTAANFKAPEGKVLAGFSDGAANPIITTAQTLTANKTYFAIWKDAEVKKESEKAESDKAEVEQAGPVKKDAENTDSEKKDPEENALTDESGAALLSDNKEEEPALKKELVKDAESGTKDQLNPDDTDPEKKASELVDDKEAELLEAPLPKAEKETSELPEKKAALMAMDVVKVTVSGFAIEERVYDGTTGTTLILKDVKIVDDNDNVIVGLTIEGVVGEYETPDAGEDKNAVLNYEKAILAGEHSSDYELDIENSQQTAEGDVTQKELEITWKPDKFIYNGQVRIPTPTVSGVIKGDEEGIKNTIQASLKVDNEPSTDAGTYNVSVMLDESKSPDKNYTIKSGDKFKFVIEPKSVKDPTVSVDKIKDQKYTGKEIKPSVVVKDSETGKTLVQGKDYTLSYKDNVKIGKATVTIKGQGNYKDTVDVQFKIVKPGSVKTGDNSMAWIFMIMALAAMMALGTTMFGIRRRR